MTVTVRPWKLLAQTMISALSLGNALNLGTPLASGFNGRFDGLRT